MNSSIRHFITYSLTLFYHFTVKYLPYFFFRCYKIEGTWSLQLSYTTHPDITKTSFDDNTENWNFYFCTVHSDFGDTLFAVLLSSL